MNYILKHYNELYKNGTEPIYCEFFKNELIARSIESTLNEIGCKCVFTVSNDPQWELYRIMKMLQTSAAKINTHIEYKKTRTFLTHLTYQYETICTAIEKKG